MGLANIFVDKIFVDKINAGETESEVQLALLILTPEKIKSRESQIQRKKWIRRISGIRSEKVRKSRSQKVIGATYIADHQSLMSFSLLSHLPKWQKLGTTCIFHPTFSPEKNMPLKRTKSWSFKKAQLASNTWKRHRHALNNVNQFEPVLQKFLAVERCHLVVMTKEVNQN